MATTGMNIGADATVVGAAGNLARAMKPFDMSGMTDKMIEERGELMDSMAKNFKEGIKLIDGANGDLKDAIEIFNKKLTNGELSTTERDELRAKVEDYRARMKAIPWGKKGKQEREDLLYELNKDIKIAKKTDAAVADVISTADNDLYDPSQLGADYITFMEQVVAYHADEETDPAFSMVKDENGNAIYSYTYVDTNGDEQKIEGDIFDIQKKINGTKKDYEFINTQNELIFGWEKYAKDNPNMKFEDIYNKIAGGLENSFNVSPDKFKSVINHAMGWSDKSYVEVLNDPQSDEFQGIVKVLSEINDSEFDFDGSGTVDKNDFSGDYVTEENINKMIKALTDPEPAQRRTAHKAAAKFYADTEAKKAFDFGVNNRPVDPNAPTGKITVDDENAPIFETGPIVLSHGGQTTVTKQQRKVQRNMINTRESGWFSNVGYGEYTWNPSKDGEPGYFSTGATDDDGELIRYSPWDVANMEGATGGHSSSHSDWQEVVNKARGHIDDLEDFEGTNGEAWTFVKDGANEGTWYDANVDNADREYLSGWDLAKREDATEGDDKSAFRYTRRTQQQKKQQEAKEKGLLTSEQFTTVSGASSDANNIVMEVNDFFDMDVEGKSNPIKLGKTRSWTAPHMISFVDPDGNIIDVNQIFNNNNQLYQEFQALPGFLPEGNLLFEPGKFSITKEGLEFHVGSDDLDDIMNAMNWLMEHSNVLQPYKRDKISLEAEGGGLELDE